MADEGIIGLDDAAKLGLKIVEMADRVKVGIKYCRGTRAKSGFEIDGVRFEVVVSLSATGER